ncbi:MAG: Uncharacterized protein Athens071424_151 [Parcubacteria group bacterium Athens0714_24]|nr:MAG: Uncharacterized protein Athens071424_151 [Parcubacteria group bacterium Athens0714_24]
MKSAPFGLVLGLFLLPFLAFADVSQFVFTTTQQAIKPNTISEKLTIQAQDASGNSFNIPQTGCLQLKTTSATGEFSSSNTSWNLASVLTMSKNTANRSFYYKDSNIGNYTLTINVALRPETETRACTSWPVEEWNIQWTATQNISVSSESTQGTGTTTTTTQTSAQNNLPTSSWPVEPQIFANADGDKIVIVGADAKFFGEALGIKKEPLENARYLWTFGDGASREGQNVIHTYSYLGDYVVVLNIASGKFSATDSFIIKIIPNSLKISEVNKDFIKISNNSNSTLDISGWGLKKDNTIFRFPPSTFIMANSSINISSAVSSLSVENGEKVDLLYPNGSIAQAVPVTSIVQVQQKQTEPEAAVVDAQENSQPINEENIVAAVAETQTSFLISKKWLILAIFLGLGGAIFAIKNKKVEKEKQEEFEIIEDR